MAIIKHCKGPFLFRHGFFCCHYSYKKKITSCDRALKHFNEFYGDYFGGKWYTIRDAMLRTKKYGALINNFADTEETAAMMENKGAHNISSLFNIQKQFDLEHNIDYKPLETEGDNSQRLAEIASSVGQKDIASIYPSNSYMPESINTGNINVNTAISLNKGGASDIISDNENVKKKSMQYNLSLASSIRASEDQNQMDLSRIIEPSEGLNSTSLLQHIPATKLHGLEDWIPESSHYQYYTSAKDFPLEIHPEENLEIPKYLKVYCYEGDNRSTFPEAPRSKKTGVLNYYLMDGASILPVLALDLQGGEKVLDMCAAPGGKSLAILQTLLTDSLHSNDSSVSRVNRMKTVFKDYVIDYESGGRWSKRSHITTMNALQMTEKQIYDRVLLDAPCTTDRLSIMEDDNNIFRPDRMKERLRIPELQTALLTTALNLVQVGGIVVYSTCTLSPIQNDGVVHMALKTAFETNGIEAIIKDMTKCFFPLRNLYFFGFGKAKPKYGQLVIPHVTNNFGPTYFAKILRTK